MSDLARTPLVALMLACLMLPFPIVMAESTPQSRPVLEMDWGNLEDPGASGGFGMRVSLLRDGQLSCRYAFVESYMGFAGSTTSVGRLAATKMRLLERVFTDAQYLALPTSLPNGTKNPELGQAVLKTSFDGREKVTRLVAGPIKVQAENDAIMVAIDSVFDACPTRPLTPIHD